MQEADFDHIAHLYDEDFTFSEIGKLQRISVWQYLDQQLPKNQSLQILELNCGTGHDALNFAQRGHQMWATDIASKMVEVTQAKAQKNGVKHLVQTQVLDIAQLSSKTFGDQKFDWVFSNFGGLNCLNEDDLTQFAQQLSQILKPKGRFIAVVMPKACLWERFYFLLKKDKKEAYRRLNKNGIPVEVEGKKVHTWYYSPQEFKHFFQKEFNFIAQKPIGLFVPPSYLEFYFSKRTSLLKGLNVFEQSLGKLGGLAKWADHFLVDLEVS